MSRILVRHLRNIVRDLAVRIPDLRALGLAACSLVWLLSAQAQGGTPQESGKTQQSGNPQASTKFQQMISQHEQLLAQAQAANRTSAVGTELNTLGELYRRAGNSQKGLDCLNEALAIEQKYHNRGAQAHTQTIMARIYTDLGQEDKALSLLNEALPAFRELGMKGGEALALNYMGRVYNDLGKQDEALKCLNQALPLWQEEGNHSGEASTLDNLGRAYSNMGQQKLALEYFSKALPLWASGEEKGGEPLTLTNMARSYDDLGLMRESLNFYKKALAGWREVGNPQGEATALTNLGRLYRNLGQPQTALDYYNQALPLWRSVGSRSGEALALNDIGRSYADMGQPAKALDYDNQGLPIAREIRSRRGEALALNNIGRDYYSLGDSAKALDIEIQALAAWRDVRDSRDEAVALMTLNWTYSTVNQGDLASACAFAALSLAREAEAPEVEGAVENTLMNGARKRQHPELAIFFGLEAVNSYEKIRKNMSGLDKDLQSGFVQSKAATYRGLAELLIQTGRLGEAEQILDLLKEQELKDTVAGAAQETGAKMEHLKMNAGQLKAESELPNVEKMARNIEELTLTVASLRAKATRTQAEEVQLATLKASLEKASGDMRAYFNNMILPDVGEGVGAGQSSGTQPADDAAPSYLQNTLAKLGPRVVGIRLLLGEHHAYVLLVTATTRKRFELKSSDDVRASAFAALKAMGSPAVDPRPQLNQLYSIVVAPLEDDLKKLEAPAAGQAAVPTLLWSLDDALRYLPMGALYDGKHYLVERFNNVLFTPESYGHMTDSPLLDGAQPSALAMGLTRSYGGLPALPGVMPELDAVVHDPAVPESHGPMQGKLLPDEHFTLAALKSELGEGKSFPVVHIASHFVMETGSGEEPYLMMGGKETGQDNGYEWNLSDMVNSSVAFHGTRLLTLSACSTAKEYKSRNGLEMDSLGMVAQQKDAEAVMATLWDVNDASTSRLMSDFYTRWVKHPADGKAEALREAQLAFLHSNASQGAGSEASERGFKKAPAPAAEWKDIGYAHPFYWAPFVLIGNYR
jgi:CHAT domain-containing protein/Tfp pilus assembly protein PilF